MRTASFKGFLSSYVRELSGINTLSLYRLTHDAVTTNPRLREPLFLYALMSDKMNVLLQATKDEGLHDEYSQMALKYNKASLVYALEMDSPQLREEYKKAYRSYTFAANRFKNEAHTKMLMQKKISKLQKNKGITTYRLHKDLGINLGNLNAYLKHNNVKKVSLKTARRVLSYLSDD